MMTARFEKRDFKKLFLYVDLLVVGIFAVALVMLVRDAYVAGFWEQRDPTLQGLSLWHMARDTAFLVASLAWIFFRFFKDKVAAMQNPWA